MPFNELDNQNLASLSVTRSSYISEFVRYP
jgi:hypothetical protein